MTQALGGGCCAIAPTRPPLLRPRPLNCRPAPSWRAAPIERRPRSSFPAGDVSRRRRRRRQRERDKNNAAIVAGPACRRPQAGRPAHQAAEIGAKSIWAQARNQRGASRASDWPLSGPRPGRRRPHVEAAGGRAARRQLALQFAICNSIKRRWPVGGAGSNMRAAGWRALLRARRERSSGSQLVWRGRLAGEQAAARPVLIGRAEISRDAPGAGPKLGAQMRETVYLFELYRARQPARPAAVHYFAPPPGPGHTRGSPPKWGAGLASCAPR